MSQGRKPSEAGGATGGEGLMWPRYWDHLTEVGITAGLLVGAEAMEGAGRDAKRCHQSREER